jgi:hypothetical protein
MTQPRELIKGNLQAGGSSIRSVTLSVCKHNQTYTMLPHYRASNGIRQRVQLIFTNYLHAQGAHTGHPTQ